jgi:hypothetical protein
VAVLLGAGVGGAPGYWLALLGAVTLAAGPATKGQPQTGGCGCGWSEVGGERMVVCEQRQGRQLRGRRRQVGVVLSGWGWLGDT